MMRARCLSYAVRALFPEVLLGTYTDLEIADIDNTKVYDVQVGEDGEVQLVHDVPVIE